MQDTLKELVLSFVAAGGFGFLNCFILEHNGTIKLTEKNQNEKKLTIILFSIVNCILFSMINCLKLNFWIILIITCILSIILTFTLFQWTVNTFVELLNKGRREQYLGEYSSKNVRELIFDTKDVLYVYLYSLNDEKILAYGCMGWQNDFENENFEFQIVPNKNVENLSFDEAYRYAQINEGSSVYINIDKNIKMIVIPEPND